MHAVVIVIVIVYFFFFVFVAIIVISNSSEYQIKRYRHEIRGLEDVAFVMMKSNDTGVFAFFPRCRVLFSTVPPTLPFASGTVKALDSIRANQNKFICLNDNLGDNDYFMHDFLAQFYQAMLPLPSPFELPPGQSNFYLR
jgi:hypothetical protein